MTHIWLTIYHNGCDILNMNNDYKQTLLSVIKKYSQFDNVNENNYQNAIDKIMTLSIQEIKQFLKNVNEINKTYYDKHECHSIFKLSIIIRHTHEEETHT